MVAPAGRATLSAVRRAGFETTVDDQSRSAVATTASRGAGMLAELMARTGNRILGEIPPNGKDYWASRFWDRDAAEAHPSIRPHYDVQTEEVANLFRAYGKDADRVLEFCCGTGLFTKQAADLTPAKEIVALDISTQGLGGTRARGNDEPGRGPGDG